MYRRAPKFLLIRAPKLAAAPAPSEAAPWHRAPSGGSGDGEDLGCSLSTMAWPGRSSMKSSMEKKDACALRGKLKAWTFPTFYLEYDSYVREAAALDAELEEAALPGWPRYTAVRRKCIKRMEI